MLLGVWFHIGLGNDYLMEKLGAFKKEEKEKKERKKNGGGGGEIRMKKKRGAVGWFPLQAGAQLV